MKYLVLLVFLVGLASCRTRWNELDDYTFEDYVKEHNKIYSCNGELEFRRAIFQSKLEDIRKHNADSSQTWKKGVNRFSDRTDEEFGVVLGLDRNAYYSTKQDQPQDSSQQSGSQLSLPLNVDWRQDGIISSVKDQGDCGSCWSFGTAEIIESYWALASGELAVLSEQQILDCTNNTDDCGGTGGCGGGTPELAYAQIQAMGGISSEWTYPYISYFGEAQQCQTVQRFSPVVTVSNWTKLPPNEYMPVMNHLATSGPLAINVDASAWSDYEAGVFSGCNQKNPDIDHVVQLVGYGTDALLGDYWLVRNSWNPTWGEDGYIRLARSSTVTCGIDVQPQDGTGCKNGPKQVTVCGECGLLYDTSFPTVAVVNATRI